MHNRKHSGFSAQQIGLVLDELDINKDDFAAFIYDAESDRYGVRHNELLAILWRAVQELSSELNTLKDNSK